MVVYLVLYLALDNLTFDGLALVLSLSFTYPSWCGGGGVGAWAWSDIGRTGGELRRAGEDN